MPKNSKKAQEPKTGAVYQNRYRQRMREKGWDKREVWIRPEHTELLRTVEAALREENPKIDIAFTETARRETVMNGVWTTKTLFEALSGTDKVASGDWKVEMIEGASPVIKVGIVGVSDEGEGILISVGTEQILVESTGLWAVEAAPASVNGDSFDTYLLKVAKLFPLQSFIIEAGSYALYGALSSASSLDNVVTEIEQMDRNIMAAYEMYAEVASDQAA